MVEGIVEAAGELIGAAFSAGGKLALWLIGIGIVIIIAVVVIESKAEDACEKKGGTIIQIHDTPACVDKASLKKLK